MTMNKRHAHHLWTKFRAVRPWHLLVLLLLCMSVSALALRHNNQTMVSLREAVYQADEEGGDVEGALRALRQHVYGHMNTGLATDNSVYPPIQLKHTYDRLVAAEQERVKNANEQIYTAAQQHCERLHPESFTGGPRVPCIREYVTSRGVPTKVIPDSLYKFDFVAPKWSPDLAGWSVVATGVVAVLLIVRLSMPLLLKRWRI